MGGLAAVHLSADNPFRVLHRDSSLRVVHEYDDPDNGQEDDDEQRYEEVILAERIGSLPCGLESLHQNVDRIGQSRHDTCEQQNGNTIANALLVDLLAQPHHHSGTGGEHQHDDDCGKYARGALSIGDDRRSLIAAAPQVQIVGQALYQTKDNRDIAGNGADLFPALLPFLGHSL